MESFAAWMECCGLLDLGFSGPRFTWCDSWDTGRRLMKRLDRAHSTADWRLLFPNASVTNLPRRSSDHTPLLMNFERKSNRIARNDRIFKFEAAWLTHPDFKNCIAESWDSTSLEWNTNINTCRDTLSNWARTVFRSINGRKKRILARLKGIQKNLESSWNRYLIKLEKKLRVEYDDILCEEELYWKQRYKGQFTVYGERNTRFFHLSTIIRRGKNRISGLLSSNGSWVDDETICLNLAKEHFLALFTEDTEIQENNFSSAFFPHLCPLLLRSLTNDISNEEIHAAVHQMGAFKAPGPDGFSPVFFQKNWATVGGSVCRLVKDAFYSNNLPAGINHTLIRLIPKVPNPERIVDFRPISLLNVSLKIITKVLSQSTPTSHGPFSCTYSS